MYKINLITAVTLLVCICSVTIVEAKPQSYYDNYTGTYVLYDDEKGPMYLSYEDCGCNMNRYLLTNLSISREVETRKIMYEKFDEFEEAIQKILRKTVKDIQDEKKESIIKHNIYLMAHLICAEVGSDGKYSMYRCGSVVLNRVDSEHYPDTIEEVIFQKGQYAVTWNGTFEREPTKEAWEVAEDLVQNGSILPKNVLYQAEFTQGSGIYEKVGRTYYCYW